jgi:phosphoglucosamine mutase
MPRLFGTDGVRGIANRELTPELAFRLGRAGAHVLAGETLHRPRFLIADDSRISCAMLESALVAGICSAGADVSLCGMLPTPGLAYLTRSLGFDAGAMISASHNSYEFNGIKFFQRDGFKLPDAVEDRIEAHLNDNGSQEDEDRPVGQQLGRRSRLSESSELYEAHLRASSTRDIKGLTVVVDCANGATSAIAPALFASLGAHVHAIGDKPDGININDRCGSTHLGALSEKVLEVGADLGVAFDGDGDRMLAVDENGAPVDGDRMLAILALDMKRKGQLTDSTLVATVMSNMGLDRFAEREGIRLVKTDVGDRYVLESMREGGFRIGGEQSGHVILLDHATTGDGILTALRLLDILKLSGLSLSNTASIMRVYPQVIRNARVPNTVKHRVLADDGIVRACAGAEAALKGQGRLLVRPSGTEPSVRVMLEGEDRDTIACLADGLVREIELRFGHASASMEGQDS